MGKIFDALEKSKLGTQTIHVDRQAADNGGDPIPEKKPAAVGEKPPLSPDIFKARETADTADRVERGIFEKQIDALDENTPRYDDRSIDRNLITLLKPQSYESEQFKLLRTKLLFPASGEPARSILVTSAIPGEGKSFVSANLAVSIAQGINEHALLMDCDLRRPMIHRYFGLNNVPGLSDYLSGGKPLSAMMLKTTVKKLTILAGGKLPDNPSELLSSSKMLDLLDEVKTRYSDRYVIIDSPPQKLTAETSAIAKHADGILIVVKYGGTSREAVKDLVQYVGKEKILGVVANWFDLRSLTHYNYGYYKAYGNYYHK